MIDRTVCDVEIFSVGEGACAAPFIEAKVEDVAFTQVKIWLILEAVQIDFPVVFHGTYSL